MSFLDTLFGGGAEQEAAQKDIAAANQYGTTANAALSTGYNTGSTALNSAISAYQPLSALGTQYNQAGNLLLGSLGAGGPQATQAAQAAFTNAPGYQGAITAGLDAINRERAITGMLNSGNTQEDALTFAQNLQNQQYGNWQSQLGSLAGLGANATQAGAAGTAAGYGSLAQLAQQYGEDTSGVAGNVENTTVGANNLQAAGEAAGAKNLLGAGLSLASLAMAPMTGGASLAGLAMKTGSNMLMGGGSPSGYGAS